MMASSDINSADVSHIKNLPESYKNAVKNGLMANNQVENPMNPHEILGSVKPVFLLEKDLFGDVKPSIGQFLNHVELYKSIDHIVNSRNLRGLQRVKGMWRIYPDSETDRDTLITKGLVLRKKLLKIYTRNPNSKVYDHDNPHHWRVRVKNIPCSAEDGQIMRAVENLGGTVHSLDRERLRVDGLLTNCQTGDRILYCEPMEKVLPRTLKIGKYMAVLLHKEQKTDSSQLTCNKCLQTGHVLRECPNEWVCTTCNNPGHKKAECPNFETVIAHAQEHPVNVNNASMHESEDSTSENENTSELKTNTEKMGTTNQSPSFMQNFNVTSASFSYNASNKKDAALIMNEPEHQGISASKHNNEIKKAKAKKKSGKKTGTQQLNKDNEDNPNQSTLFFHFQGNNNVGTPDGRKDKRAATTPTDQIHERTSNIQKPKGP
ncbi:CNBP [Mytilus edulis]|uniref:CNBP n=1 Tax=Mytilus edulis TaxID=6550 RepID=A0A8S3T026_MYTED|nr:CNBP [Mytilus edulis]